MNCSKLEGKANAAMAKVPSKTVAVLHRSHFLVARREGEEERERRRRRRKKKNGLA